MLAIDKTESGLCYSAYRMMPPGEATYFYSVNGIPQTSESELVTDSSKTSMSKALAKLNVPKTNIIDNVIQT
jgi:hypothetical protein